MSEFQFAPRGREQSFTFRGKRRASRLRRFVRRLGMWYERWIGSRFRTVV